MEFIKSIQGFFLVTLLFLCSCAHVIDRSSNSVTITGGLLVPMFIVQKRANMACDGSAELESEGSVVVGERTTANISGGYNGNYTATAESHPITRPTYTFRCSN